MTNNLHNRGKINEQTKQEKSKLINSTINNQHTNNKTNQETETILLQGQMWKLTEVSAKTTLKIHHKYGNKFTRIENFKSTSSIQG